MSLGAKKPKGLN